MNTITVVCSQCGTPVEKPAKEIKRQMKKGRTKFFCNESCGARFSNKSLPRLTKVCPICRTEFITSGGVKQTTYCSVRCSNQTARERRLSPEGLEVCRQVGLAHKANLDIAAAMRNREAWKYKELAETLVLPHEFEVWVGKYIFDLCIPSLSLLVEFDGPDHKALRQVEADRLKDETAASLGYRVVRVPVERAKVIPATVLQAILA